MSQKLTFQKEQKIIFLYDFDQIFDRNKST